MLHRNEGTLDRAVRLAAGIVLLPLGLLVLGGVSGEIVGLVIATVGVIGLATGATGFCAMYVPFHFSTAHEKHVGTRLSEGGV